MTGIIISAGQNNFNQGYSLFQIVFYKTPIALVKLLDPAGDIINVSYDLQKQMFFNLNDIVISESNKEFLAQEIEKAMKNWIEED